MNAPINRRAALVQAGRAGLVLGLGSLASPSVQARTSANETVNVAVIGVRGRGRAHISGFASLPNCRVSHLCDVDSDHFGPAVSELKAADKPVPTLAEDMRRVLDDKSVDAVVVATPDHWHALATIWACQSGKDVYVEKPVSNNCWEGRQMVAAARKHNRIVQSGMQSRSAPYVISAKEYITSGKLGRIELVRVYNQKPQENVVRSTSPQPKSLNWDMWNGCAPAQEFSPTMYSVWRAFWRYGGGEITNDGIHQLDIARFVLGLDLPKTVYTLARPFAEAGEAETPDTVTTTFDFGHLTMVFEQTLYAPYMLKSDQEVRNGDIFPWWQHNGERIEIFGTKGQMMLCRHGGGWQVFGRQKARQPVVLDQMYGRFPDRWHHENFLASVRSRELPVGDIEEGHKTAMLCHAANISYRVGNALLTLDAANERFTDNDDANKLLRYDYRKPYEVPGSV